MTSQHQHELLSPGEAAGAGAAIVITLYGLVVVAASLVLDEELVPTSMGKAGALMLALLAVGAVLGGGMKAALRR